MSFTVEHTTLTGKGGLKQYRLTFATIPEARDCQAAFGGAERGVCTVIFNDDTGKYWCIQPGPEWAPERVPYKDGDMEALDTSKYPSERIDFRAADPRTHAFFLGGEEVSGGEFSDWAERKGKKP